MSMHLVYIFHQNFKRCHFSHLRELTWTSISRVTVSAVVIFEQQKSFDCFSLPN